jgi:hypothetical protein
MPSVASVVKIEQVKRLSAPERSQSPPNVILARDVKRHLCGLPLPRHGELAPFVIAAPSGLVDVMGVPTAVPVPPSDGGANVCGH